MGREIRIGYEPDFPPLTYADDGTARGLIIDLLRAVFERLRTVPVFIPVVLSQHEAAVSQGDVDAISYKATVAGREDVWSFSDPILTTGIAWFAPFEGRRPPFARVATPAKGPLAGLLGSLFPGIEVTAVDSYDAALCAVIDRSVDAAALNYHVGADLARRHYPRHFEIPTAPFRPQDVAFAVAAGDPAGILPDFNRALSEFLDTGARDRLEQLWTRQKH